MRHFMVDPDDPKIVHLQRAPAAATPTSLIDAAELVVSRIVQAQSALLNSLAEIGSITASSERSQARIDAARTLCEAHAQRARQNESYAIQAERLIAAGDIEGCIDLARRVKASLT